jgi:signal transduction histidine kinase
MPMKSSARWRRNSKAYSLLAATLLASVVAAVALDFTSFGGQFDKYAYDFLFRLEQPKPWQPSSIVLAIDEKTLAKYGSIRPALADGLEKIAAAHPRAVAVDVILDAPGASEQVDANLETAFADTPHLILASYLLRDNSWDEPLARFRRHAAAVAEVHGDFDAYDSVTRDLPLANVGGHDRRWALALQAWLMATGRQVVESPDDLTAGDARIPTTSGEWHVMRIRYAMSGIPRVSIAELDANPSLAARFADMVVFAGDTEQAARDSWMTPYSDRLPVPGVEIHANAYETLARGLFLYDAPWSLVLLCCVLLACATGLTYALTSGWATSVAAGAVVVVSQAIPAIAFANSVVWPWLPGTLTAAFAVSAAAAWRLIVVRRQLLESQGEKDRYQRAMQFVTHEMRTPLTAIQGSSELISRYANMPEAKRTQIAQTINSETKRLARMIETFLSVERLSAGQMELKRERFPLAGLVESCAERARPLAERKRIEIDVEPMPADELIGDRELMEYAVYNLLTNAVKYSPPETRVRVFGEDERGDLVRLSIKDQGIGMDRKEVARIFEKFYRTKRAEQSGEAGTGIGLSIVEQIVTQHGGSIHVESEPGKGSKFSLVLKRTHD